MTALLERMRPLTRHPLRIRLPRRAPRIRTGSLLEADERLATVSEIAGLRA